MIGNVEIKVMGEKRSVSSGLTYYDLAKEYQPNCSYPILLVKIGNTYKELSEYVCNGDEIEFSTMIDDSVADDDIAIRMEDIISKIK